MLYHSKREQFMKIEVLNAQELSSIKGGEWVYLEGKWYWIKDTR